MLHASILRLRSDIIHVAWYASGSDVIRCGLFEDLRVVAVTQTVVTGVRFTGLNPVICKDEICFYNSFFSEQIDVSG